MTDLSTIYEEDEPKLHLSNFTSKSYTMKDTTKGGNSSTSSLKDLETKLKNLTKSETAKLMGGKTSCGAVSPH